MDSPADFWRLGRSKGKNNDKDKGKDNMKKVNTYVYFPTKCTFTLNV